MSIIATVSRLTGRCLALALVIAMSSASNADTSESTFSEDLKLVDKALTENSSGALKQSLESCLRQRNHAIVLSDMGMVERARRALQYCFDSLHISRENNVEKVAAPTQEELEAAANKEYVRALALTPDVANGLAIYRECAACHEPEGWGLQSGMVPQIAGQHRKVVIKQLADFRAGHRLSNLMAPYASVESIGGAQAVADVAEYISTLEISTSNGKGSGTNPELGQKIYAEQCAECHGASGEGDNDGLAPRIQAQHYKYLLSQFRAIRDGDRLNGNARMMSLAKELTAEELAAVLDYSSRMTPPQELQAPEGWKNPDFNQP